MNNDELAAALLDEAISERVGQAGTPLPSLWMAKIVAKGPDGTLYADIVGGERRVPCQVAQVTADVGDTVEVRFQDGRVIVTANRTDPPPASSNTTKLEEKVVETRREVQIVKTEKADVTDLTAAKADISQLRSGFAEFETVVANDLLAATGRIGTIEADYLKAADMQAETARVDNLLAGKASVADLNAAKGRIDDLEADHVSTTDLQAVNGDITNLKAKDATIEGNVSAATGRIGTLETENTAVKGRLTAAEGNITTLQSTKADISVLESDYAQIDLANVNNAYIKNGVFDKAAVFDAAVFDLTGDTATIKEINADNITVRNLHTKNLTVDTADGYVTIGSKKTPTKEYIDSLKDELQQEIDGAVETFTADRVPLLNNYPASQWADDKTRAKHVGDICYVQKTGDEHDGFCYRFSYDSTSQQFSWVLIKDSSVTKALGDISDLKTFQSDTTQWIEETDEGLTQIRENHTELSGVVDGVKATADAALPASTFTQFESTTFKTVKDTVDSQSTKFNQLTTTLGTNADGTTKENDIVHRTSAIEQDVSGFKQTVSETYATKTELGTETSNRQTAIQQVNDAIVFKANSSDVYTKTQTDGLISTEVTNRNSAIQQSAEAINLSVSQNYTTKTEFNALEVGGRNLLYGSSNISGSDFGSLSGSPMDGGTRGSAKHVESVNAWTGIGIALHKVLQRAGAKIGDTVTLSIWVSNTSEEGVARNIYLYRAKTSSNTPGINNPGGANVSVGLTLKAGEWQRVWCTFEVTDYSLNTNKTTRFETNTKDETNKMLWTAPMLEFSTKPSPWTPAPEDQTAYTDAQVSAAKAEIKVTTDGITSEVEKKTDKASIISTIRQSAETVKIKASQVEIDGTAIFTAISDDVDDAITDKGYQTASQVNSAITSKGYATTGQAQEYANTAESNAKADTASKLTSYSTTSQMNTAISDAVDAIEVGGRNLLRWTAKPTYTSATWNKDPKDTTAWSRWSANITIEDTDSGIKGTFADNTQLTGFCIPLAYEDAAVGGEDYVLSFDYRTNLATIGAPYLLRASGGNIPYAKAIPITPSETEWKHFSYVLNFPSTAGQVTRALLFPYAHGSGGGKWLEIKDASAKLEKGNKPTDWSPAPEDTEAAIDTAVKSVAQNWFATCSTAAGTKDKVATITPATTDFQLKAGVTVNVKFTNNNSYSATAANPITLNVNGSGAKNIYYANSATPTGTNTTAFGRANYTNTYVYDGTHWVWVSSSADNNSDTYNRVRWQNAIKVLAKPTGTWRLLCGTSAGYTQVAKGVSFDLAYPILTPSNQPEAGATTDAAYTCINSLTFTNTAAVESGVANSVIYLKGKVSGNTFTIDSTTVFTCKVPTSADGYFYIPLGIMYSATAGYFQTSKDLYAFIDGKFRQVTPTEVVAEQYIYCSSASGTSSMAKYETWVDAPSSVTASTQNAWTVKRPEYATAYPVLWVAKQTKRLDGTVTCTTPVKDDTTTVIDGGHITTGTIDASKATITNIDATQIKSGTIDAERINASSLIVGSSTLGATLDGKASTTVGNPNLSPFFEHMPFVTRIDGYWQDANTISAFTPLEDGWAHFHVNNTGTSTINNYFRMAASPGVVQGRTYTCLVEIRNIVTNTATSATLYTQQSTAAQFWGSGGNVGYIDGYDGFSMNNKNLAEGAHYFPMKARGVTEHSTSGKRLIDFNWQVPAGAEIELDFRVSLYEGEYNGPWKPYSGSQLTRDSEIGGRNLLLGTSEPKTSPALTPSSSGYAVWDTYSLYAPYSQVAKAYEFITVSFDWSCTATGGNWHLECGKAAPWVWGTIVNAVGTRNALSNYVDVSSTNQSGHISITFMVTSSQETAGDTFGWLRIRVDGTDWSGKTFTISKAKAEKGNKPTDWTPAPEDVDAAVSDLSDRLTDFQKYADGKYVDATFVPDEVPAANIVGQLTVDKIAVDSLRAALLQVASLLIGSNNGFHIEASGSRMSFKDGGGNEVAYIAVDANGKSTFYMTRSVVVEDMHFGNGLWKWYKRSNNNMSVKWMG